MPETNDFTPPADDTSREAVRNAELAQAMVARLEEQLVDIDATIDRQRAAMAETDAAFASLGGGARCERGDVREMSDAATIAYALFEGARHDPSRSARYHKAAYALCDRIVAGLLDEGPVAR